MWVVWVSVILVMCRRVVWVSLCLCVVGGMLQVFTTSVFGMFSKVTDVLLAGSSHEELWFRLYVLCDVSAWLGVGGVWERVRTVGQWLENNVGGVNGVRQGRVQGRGMPVVWWRYT